MASLYWARNDLRLHDNPALHAAAQAGSAHAIYLCAPGQWRRHDDAPAKVDFWLRNVQALSDGLASRGVAMHVVSVDTWAEAPDAIEAFCLRHGIESVHCNIEYGVNEQGRDQAVAQRLACHGIALDGHHGATLLRPGSVLTGQGEPYRVFTPFARRCRHLLREALPRPVPAPALQGRVIAAPACPAAVPGFAEPPSELRDLWSAGETHAEQVLADFVDGALQDYHTGRDVPGRAGTSRLSPYLAAGVLSPGQCLRAALAANQGETDSGRPGPLAWINELLWREFYLHLLASHPALSMHRPMKPHTEQVPWRDAPGDLQAWQQGRTGIPIVDAGMRQLRQTGWMHNRLRMVTAMFLCKNLLVDWRLGEQWFMRTLIDGDLASNNGGWQWCASTGADAAPYFRVFNPVSQSRRFDPCGQYLRRWVPELASLDDKAIHEPSAAQRRACGYPDAIVDLKTSRQRAIDAFSGLR